MNNWNLLVPLLFLLSMQGALTGVFGAPSIVATIIASHAASPRRALVLSTLAQLVGPCLFGVAVATTVGSEVVDPYLMTPRILYSALAVTVLWMLLAWYFRIPSSSTHALIGGMVGAVAAALGVSSIHESGLLKVLLGLLLTAPLGIVGGFLLVRLCRWLTRNAAPTINRRFNQGQFVTALVLGLAVGSNNAQNAMGVTVLGLMSTGFLPKFEVPVWVVVGTAACLAAGNLIGGMRLMRSVGVDMFPVRPLHGFSAQMSSMFIIIASSLVGGGVSTTHVTSMSIVGAGVAESRAMVQWRLVRRIMLTWVITIPVTATLAYVMCLGLIRLGVP